MQHIHRLLLVILAACQEVPPLYPPTAPEPIREACAVTQRKCTACHERDRIVDAHHSVAEWNATVDRMRRFPSSSITQADREIILRCLTYSEEPTAVLAPHHQSARLP